MSDTGYINESQCPLFIKTNGIIGHVIKDGVELSKVRSVHIDLEAGKLPKVLIELITSEMEMSINECRCKIQPNPTETAE